MAKVKIYNSKGEVVKDQKLVDSIFGVTVRPDVVKQVLVAQQANQRQNLAHTKDRSEVRGGGRKPWRQKGTGRARHGSSRSPIWIGGGVTFGPRNERNWSQKVNKSVKQKALYMALSDRVAADKFYLVDNFDLKNIKTKDFKEILQKLPSKNDKTLIIIEKKDDILERSAKNLPKIKVIKVNNINILDIVSHQSILMTVKALEKLEKVYKK